MPPLKKALRTALAALCNDAAPFASGDYTLDRIRTELDLNHGWSCDDNEWKRVNKQVKREWEKLIEEQANADTIEPTQEEEDEEDQPSPRKKQKRTESESRSDNDSDDESDEEEAPTPPRSPRPKRIIKSKYDRAAHKNLGAFMGAVGNSLLAALTGGDDYRTDSDDDDFPGSLLDSDEDSDASSASSDDEPASKRRKKNSASAPASAEDAEEEGSDSAASSTSKSKALLSKSKMKSKPKLTDASKVKGRGRARAKSEFKSAEYIKDSDDSSPEVPSRPLSASDVDDDDEDEGKEKREKRKAPSSAKGKGKVNDKEKKERKPRAKKAPVKKEGDADKGTEAEEERIKQMKSLLREAGTTRAFTAATGAERTLSVARRNEHLERLLDGLGLKVERGGKLPSVARAREVGRERELEKERESLTGATHHTGLRDGKSFLPSSTSASSDDDKKRQDQSAKKKNISGLPSPKKKAAERKAFSAFLGEQSDSE
ncbi:hypothetical protein JCM1841_005632 [Sporobolomyces salmonicolor]